LPLLLSATVSTAVSGRLISRRGRYKVFPVTGLALMTVGLLLLSSMDAGTSRATSSVYLVVFGLGFGMVSQVLTLAIQNAVDRRDIGIATASANLFRSLGGSVGVALFGAVFASRLPSSGGAHSGGFPTGQPDAVAHALHTVFLVAAPIAGLGMLVALLLHEVPLRGPAAAGAGR
jgi:MFS family permease